MTLEEATKLLEMEQWRLEDSGKSPLMVEALRMAITEIKKGQE